MRAFALAPGVVRTRLFVEAGGGEHINTAALPAATALYLTSGRADWLSGRSVGPHVLYNARSCSSGTIPQIGISQRWSGTGKMRSSSRRRS